MVARRPDRRLIQYSVQQTITDWTRIVEIKRKVTYPKTFIYKKTHSYIS